ncbi:unnamed protein product [Rotaria sp. Silwood2]|nr:unnamed protein product [Rotaria sp. Silwood2]
MATASSKPFLRPSSAVKAPCATCSKPIGIYRCEGCEKQFCPNDLSNHRNELSKQLEQLGVEHNKFQETLIETAKDLRTHELISRINAWEKESKAKIKQAAEEARQQIVKHAETNIKDISTRFREMAERLHQAQQENIYDERDLKRWMEQLEHLKENFVSPSSVVLEEEPGTFIAKIQVKDLETLGKKFENVYGNIQIQDGGLLAIGYNNNSQISQVRSKGEYSGGIHKIQMKIEQYSNGFLFFGISSKSARMQYNSCTLPSSYGWTAGKNAVYINGQCFNNYEEYASDYKLNDTVELELDCYRRLIRIRNDRSNKQYELPIDLQKCPFPWILNINLQNNGDRLRIVV